MDTLRLGQQNTMLDVVRQLRQMDQVLDRITSADVPNYEQGTWTPAYAFSTSGSVTTSIAAGYFVRIGSVVYITMRIASNTASSPVGNVTITGLPFTSNNTANRRYGLAIGEKWRWGTDMPNMAAVINENNAFITLYKQASSAGATSAVLATDMTFPAANYNILVISGFYFV